MIPSGVGLWSQQVAIWLEVLTEALAELYCDERHDETEDMLNEELYRRIISVNYERKKSRRPALVNLPTYDARRPPLTAYADAIALKRPDIQFSLQDASAPDADHSIMILAVECKRLSSSTTMKWSSDYVSKGVARFVDDSHRYGYGVDSGVMVGYLQNQGVSSTKNSIDAHLVKRSWPLLHATSLGPSPLIHHTHRLVRSFPVSTFILDHYWVNV